LMPMSVSKNESGHSIARIAMYCAALLAKFDLASVIDLPGAISGRQIRHGRYPACSASAADSLKVQFSSFGVRARHTGRQYIPVDETPTKNLPSKRVSLDAKAS